MTPVREMRRANSNFPAGIERNAEPIAAADDQRSAENKNIKVEMRCSDITNDQLGISGETGHGGANLCIY